MTLFARDWSARHSLAHTEEQWRDWLRSEAQPDPDFRPPCTAVAARAKRRWTSLTHLAAAPLADLVDRGLDLRRCALILASRHGEIAILHTLLQQMAAKETLSPFDFCNSVHHTATGYLSIAWKITGPVRAVAAGERTLGAALLDALSLASGWDGPIVLVAAEQAPDPAFAAPPTPAAGVGAACVFAREGGSWRLDTEAALAYWKHGRTVFDLIGELNDA